MHVSTHPYLWPISLRRYDQMVDLGWLNQPAVELIRGKIIHSPPRHEAHGVAVMLGHRALRAAFKDSFTIRPQLSLHLGNASRPKPDLAVVAGSERDTLITGTPSSALLLIEISDKTLGLDSGSKASLYAEFGLADYWIVNLVNRQVEVHRAPIQRLGYGHRCRYADIQVFRSGESIAPLAAPDALIQVADLLP